MKGSARDLPLRAPKGRRNRTTPVSPDPRLRFVSLCPVESLLGAIHSTRSKMPFLSPFPDNSESSLGGVLDWLLTTAWGGRWPWSFWLAFGKVWLLRKLIYIIGFLMMVPGSTKDGERGARFSKGGWGMTKENLRSWNRVGTFRESNGGRTSSMEIQAQATKTVQDTGYI